MSAWKQVLLGLAIVLVNLLGLLKQVNLDFTFFEKSPFLHLKITFYSKSNSKVNRPIDVIIQMYFDLCKIPIFFSLVFYLALLKFCHCCMG